MTTKPNDGGPAFPTTQENGANCGEPGMTNITIPLEVANAASEALGNFVSDHGWSDSDMQAMDNLDSYIARHKAIRAELAKPSATPAWHDAPTEPGIWLCDEGGPDCYTYTAHNIVLLNDPALKDDECRWYGPIPQDVTYQPKGSMCGACQHRSEDCSRLPFERMRVVESLNHGAVQVVRCSEYMPQKWR